MRSYIKILTIAVLLSTTLLFQNCADIINNSDHGPSSSSSSTSVQSQLSDAAYAERVAKAQVVLQTYCVSCHSPSNTVPNSKIPDILNFSALETSKYITIGSPQISPVYLLMLSKTEPRDSREVSSLEIETIRTWLMGRMVSDELFGGGGGVGSAPITPTFNNIRTYIVPICINCHANMNTYAGFVSNGRIVANNLNASAIRNRINFAQTNGQFMPRNGSPLPDFYKKLLDDWINAGAPNN